MRLRVVSLPALALLASGVAGVLIPTIPLPASAQDEPAVHDMVWDEFASPAAEDTPTEVATAPAGIDRRVVSVGRGDTLMDLLTGASVPRTEADGAINALSTVYDPRKLKVGQQVTVLFEPHRGGSRRFVGLELTPDVVRSVSVARTRDAGFESAEVKKEVRRELVAAEAEIRSSLFEAGNGAGVPVSVMLAAIRTYSYEVDFQRDLQPGDRFKVLYERFVTADGKVAGEGDVLFASLTVDGEELAIYRHKTRDGRADYFDRAGESIRRALLLTPIDGARLTSGFGMRMHPILGYSKMHKGLDFGAPTGTPIYAAGNGVVEEIGPHGAYGNYIRIRHNTDVTTAYAHMSRFAKSVRRGGRVEQGDVIGYVGATGRVTGAHLHYEVLKKGQQVNPKAADLPTGEKLAGRELQAFEQTVRATDRAYAEARAGLQLAHTTDRKACSGTATC
ncbi:M23 family metallopeptidase [Azospirillum sp. TSO22-1]|uniref:M23 family metallopeptidase n=1 Tax=Azospirillum sp. TSO22-1 TaxID=716789 RepID=UPI000D60EC9C|nr:M23 family metallopeptidase [Azospirillum sp. TSO22-1]PWC55038.1 peptidase M23 [Azospirillum sp. TSO22-1]